jgi:O-antigen ligase
VFAIAVWRLPASRVTIAKAIVLAALIIAMLTIAAETFRMVLQAYGTGAMRSIGGRAAGIDPTAVLAPLRAGRGLTTSNAERWLTVSLGLEMFKAHPWFGAGLGAFMATEAHNFSRPLVIHSTPLWLLAEFGLIGSAVFFCVGLYMFVYEVRGDASDRASVFLLMLLAGFFSTALVHDLLYQRAFWLLLGGALALRKDLPYCTGRENAPGVSAASAPQPASAT